MANTIKLKSSSVAGKAPTTADLQLRELAINTTDGKLFLKKSVSGTESIVEIGASTGGSGGGSVGGGTDKVFVETGQTISTNYTLSTGYNAVTAGPVAINSGVTVTIPSGAAWVVV